ncbi:class I tRNA ligase family protein, partial [Patescibacteria group bacterium]|nr:class I tRNA ligase family protein [Patescibacteria group bacterium]
MIDEKLLKPYGPKETEPRIYKIWEESGYFNPDNLPATCYKLHATCFTIVIPPPNVTGSLHMGHALNATIQDILIRQKRMQGYKTLWVPGTDHAGIATQNVVEKELKKQGTNRHELGREKFLEKVWEWKEKYGNIILDQLKKLGASCDWSRERFTMDHDYAQKVEKAFLHYYKKGWIYQGDRVVNWCTRCQTSLSDLELEYEETKGKLYYIKYGPITVATTRPETMLGDTAVAVNPKDKRYKDLIGKTVTLPIMNREIPIIADRLVESEFGTGAVKVTPA